MTSLTALAASQARGSMQEWETRRQAFQTDIDTRRRQRSCLFPAEAATLEPLPSIEDFEPAPCLRVADRSYPLMDSVMLRTSLVQVRGLWAPAFAIYDLDESDTAFEVRIRESGANWCVQDQDRIDVIMNRKPAACRYTPDKMYRTWCAVVGWNRHTRNRWLRYVATVVSGVLAAIMWVPAVPETWAALTAVVSSLYCLVSLFGANAAATDVSASKLRRLDVVLRHRMRFVLPDHVREHAVFLRQQLSRYTVDDMRSNRYCSIPRYRLLVVEEARNWELSCIQRPDNPDPLLMILDITTNRYYLADAFDKTSLEDFLAREGTAG